VPVVEATEQRTMAGSALTEVSELMVIAIGPSPTSAVITATPAAW
jgi:hypothetical protein